MGKLPVKKVLSFLFAALFLSLSFQISGWCEEYSVVQITDNEYDDEHPKIHAGQIAWMRKPIERFQRYAVFLYRDHQMIRLDGDTYFSGFGYGNNCQIHNGNVVWQQNGTEVYLYDGQQRRVIVNFSPPYPYGTQVSNPQLYKGQVAWKHWVYSPVAEKPQIFFYDGNESVQITNDNTWKDWPRLSSGRITWMGRSTISPASYEIFLYDGAQILKLTDNDYEDGSPQIYNGQVTWYGWDGHDYEIFLYDGTQTVQLTHNDYLDSSPHIDNGQIVWMGYDGHDYEIFFYSGNKITQLTDNDYDDRITYEDTGIHNGQAAWTGYVGRSDGEIFLYDGMQTIQLTDNSVVDYNPRIHSGQVTWQGRDGHDYEIYLAAPGVTKIPLGGRLEVAEEAGHLYRIYVPSRWGGKLTVETDSGLVELYYPDTSAKIAGPDTALTYSIPFEDAQGSAVNNHGWYYVKHTGLAPYVISNTFIEEGEADYRPWNFWYWPFKRQDNPVKNLYGAGGALEKYDVVFGTKAGEFEEKNFGGDRWQGWEGHCWGSVVASILLPQPKAITYSGQSFTQEEIEGLVSKLGNGDDTKFNVIVNDIPSLKPQAGVDDTDEFADRFHKGLLDYLRIKGEGRGRPLQSNLRDPKGVIPDEIWNHAIYKYSSAMEESEEGNENIIKITTTVYANDDRFPSDDAADRVETYVYKLRYNTGGEIDADFVNNGQDWINAAGFAPKSLRSIRGSRFNNIQNHYVLKSNIEKLGIEFPVCADCS